MSACAPASVIQLLMPHRQLGTQIRCSKDFGSEAPLAAWRVSCGCRTSSSPPGPPTISCTERSPAGKCCFSKSAISLYLASAFFRLPAGPLQEGRAFKCHKLGRRGSGMLPGNQVLSLCTQHCWSQACHPAGRHQGGGYVKGMAAILLQPSRAYKGPHNMDTPPPRCPVRTRSSRQAARVPSCPQRPSCRRSSRAGLPPCPARAGRQPLRPWPC